jgi:hypothetical protein
MARRPVKKDRIQTTKKTKNKIFAIPAAVPAIPPNPRIAAIIAMIKKIKVQRSMVLPPSVFFSTLPAIVRFLTGRYDYKN